MIKMDLPVPAMHVVYTTENDSLKTQNESSKEVIDRDSAVKSNYSVKVAFERYCGHPRVELGRQPAARGVAANSTAGVRRGLRNYLIWRFLNLSSEVAE